MKKMKRYAAAALITGLFLLTACGKSSDQAMYEASLEACQESAGALSNDIYSYDGGEYEMAATEDSDAADPKESVAGEGEAGALGVQEQNRKLIKTVDLNVETEQFDELLFTIQEKTNAFGGYIEQSYTYNGSSYYGDQKRDANMTIRIPADQLEAFLSAMAEVSNVVSRNDSITDITLQYVDMESHKKVLQAEQERLLALLEQAETIEDIITLESRLSEVRYQIESMESQLRTYDNKVDYSTIMLNISEVKKYTPVEEMTVWQKMSAGFADSLQGIGDGLLTFFIWLVSNIPYLVFWAVILAVILLVVRGIIRLKRKKSKKNPAGKGKRSGSEEASGQKERDKEAPKQDKEVQKGQEAEPET